MRSIGAVLLLLALGTPGAVSVADSGTPSPDTMVMPDLAGPWTGADWGAVNLRRRGDAYEGSYTDTYGKDGVRLRLWFSRRSGTFEGVWSEGKYRFGSLSLRVTAGGDSARGVYSADPTCEHRPGLPAAEGF